MKNTALKTIKRKYNDQAYEYHRLELNLTEDQYKEMQKLENKLREQRIFINEYMIKKILGR